MGRKLRKTLSYALRIHPKNVPANFSEILITDNGEIDVSKKWVFWGVCAAQTAHGANLEKRAQLLSSY